MICEYCGAQTTDAYLCKNHTNRLRNVLYDIAEAWQDSDITYARQDKHATQRTGSTGGGSKHTQMAYNINCAEVRREANAVVRMWAIEVGRGLMPGWIQGTRPQCRWLAPQVQKIAGMDFAGQMLRELEDELKSINRSVDRPPDCIVVGQCGVCGQDLTAPLRTDSVVCPHCEVVVDVRTQKEAKIKAAMDDHYLPHELAGLVPMVFQMRITEKTIERWIRQRRLEPNDAGRCSLRSVVELAEKVAVTKASA